MNTSSKGATAFEFKRASRRPGWKRFALSIPFLLALVTVATGPAPAQEWKNYTNPNWAFLRAVAVSPTHVFSGSWGGGLLVYIKGEDRWLCLTTAEGLTDNLVKAVLIDGTTLWVAGEWEGVAKTDLTGDLTVHSNWQHLNTSNSGLGHNNIQCMALVDGGTKIWFGTWGGGISRYSKATASWDTPITETNGLGSNYVCAIVQDARGVLWIATENGLTRREGTTNETFRTANSGLLDNRLRSLAINGDDLWITGEGDRTAKIDTRLSASDLLIASNWTIHARGFNQMAVRNSEVWGVRWDGAYCWNGSSWDRYHTGNTPLAGNNIHGLAVDPADQSLWFALEGGTTGMARVTSGMLWTAYPAFPNVPMGGDFTSIACQPDGVVSTPDIVWVGQWNGAGLDRFDGSTWSNQFHANFERNGITVDAARNRVWCGTEQGLWLVEGGGSRQWLAELPFQNKWVRRVVPDGDNAVWIGVGGAWWTGQARSGVAHLQIDPFDVLSSYTRQSTEELLIENAVTCLERFYDQLWMGTRDVGINRFDDGRWVAYHYFWDKSTWVNYSIPHPEWWGSNYVWHIVADDGIMWFFTEDGVWRLDPHRGTDQWRNFRETNTVMGDRFAVGGAVDGQHLWVANWNAGLARLQFDHRGELVDQRLYKQSEGLADKNVSSIDVDGNYLWVATQVGLSRFNKHFPEADIATPIAGTRAFNLQIVGSGVLEIHGTALDYEDFQSYRLEHGAGMNPATWSTAGISDVIAGMVDQGKLGTWDTSTLPDGPHTLRLVVRDSAANENIDTVVVWLENGNNPTTPAPPTHVTAKSVSGRRLRIDWVRSGSPSVAEYRLYSDRGTGVMDYSTATVVVAATTSTAYVNEASYGVADGATARFVVRARDGAGREETNENWSLPCPVHWADLILEVSGPIRSSPMPYNLRAGIELETVIGSLTHGGGGSFYGWRHDGVRIPELCKTNLNHLAATPAVGDIDGDLAPEIVTAWHNVDWGPAGLEVWDANGRRLWSRSIGTGNNGDRFPVSCPTIARVVGPANREILIGSFSNKMYAFNAAGATMPTIWPLDTRNVILSTAAVGDVNADGEMEVVFGSNNADIYVCRHTGEILSGWSITTGQEVNGSPALVDIDGDGDLELFVGSGDGIVYGLHHDGTQEQPHFVDGWNPDQYTTSPRMGDVIRSSPAIGDLDGDGRPEVVIGSNNGRVGAFRASGQKMAGFWPVTVPAAVRSSPAIGDIDGDRRMEIVCGCDDGNLYAWNHDGSRLTGWPKSTSGYIVSTPTITDLDGDGKVEVLVGSGDHNLYIWKLNAPYDPKLMEWPMFHHDTQHTGLYRPGGVRTGTRNWWLY